MTIGAGGKGHARQSKPDLRPVLFKSRRSSKGKNLPEKFDHPNCKEAEVAPLEPIGG